MQTHVAVVRFLAPDGSEHDGVLAVCVPRSELADQLDTYLRRIGVTLTSEPEFRDVLEVARAGRLSTAMAEAARTVGPHWPVHLLAMRPAARPATVAAVASNTAPTIPPDRPVMIVFNVAENLMAYRRLSRGGDRVVFLASFAETASGIYLPATVGVVFSGWNAAARACWGALERAMIVSDPPSALIAPAREPVFFLMAQETGSISHPLDPYWTLAAPGGADGTRPSGPTLYRAARSDDGLEPVGPAVFDFDILEFSVLLSGADAPEARRLLSLACQTALADAYLEGLDVDFLPDSLRLQSGIPDSASFGSFDTLCKRCLPQLEAAVLRAWRRNDHRMDYGLVHTLPAAFAIAAESDAADATLVRLGAMCDANVGPHYSPKADQLCEVLLAEAAQPAATRGLML